MIDTSFLRSLERFGLIIRKKVTSSYVGERQTSFLGRGLIYKDHAIYTPEEDFKDIDWRVFARTDKLYVKRYEEERNLTVHIIVDTSASMDFGTKFKKSEYASMLGLGFAHIALQNNERFVLSTFGDDLDLFKPHKGRKQLLSVLSYLNRKNPTGITKLSRSLIKYQKRIKSKSLVVVISDFLIDPHELEEALVAYRKHDVRLIQVLDAVEETLAPYEGEFKLRDLEAGTELKTYISPLLKKEYVAKVEGHRARLAKIAEESGARFFHVNTGTPIFDAFFSILTQKG